MTLFGTKCGNICSLNLRLLLHVVRIKRVTAENLQQDSSHSAGNRGSWTNAPSKGMNIWTELGTERE